MSFLLLCLFGFEVSRGSRACSVGVLHFLRFLLFPRLTLRISMGPSHSSVLRIGSNPVEASSSGRTDGGNDSLAVVVHRAAPGEPFFPLDKGKGKINEIRYPRCSEYLRAARMLRLWAPVGLNLCMVRSLRPDMGPRLGSKFGALTC